MCPLLRFEPQFIVGPAKMSQMANLDYTSNVSTYHIIYEQGPVRFFLVRGTCLGTYSFSRRRSPVRTQKMQRVLPHSKGIGDYRVSCPAAAHM